MSLPSVLLSQVTGSRRFIRIFRRQSCGGVGGKFGGNRPHEIDGVRVRCGIDDGLCPVRLLPSRWRCRGGSVACRNRLYASALYECAARRRHGRRGRSVDVGVEHNARLRAGWPSPPHKCDRAINPFGSIVGIANVIARQIGFLAVITRCGVKNDAKRLVALKLAKVIVSWPQQSRCYRAGSAGR